MVGPPSPLRLRRLRLGLALVEVALALKSNPTDLSLLERRLVSRPELERKLLAWYATLERQRRPRRATA